jgi:hypothetical protein
MIPMQDIYKDKIPFKVVGPVKQNERKERIHHLLQPNKMTLYIYIYIYRNKSQV